MLKKTLATIALAVLAVFTVPAAANAAGYVPNSNITISGNQVAGSIIVIDFSGASFTAGENISFSVSGAGVVTLSNFKSATATLVKPASSTGAASLNVTLPADATGSYTTTATGLTSGSVGTATITVKAADAGATSADSSAGGLASTGYNAPVLLIWAAAGALLLGVALVVVLSFVRRRRLAA
ncbi:sortase [Cryobacterium breve]|uniref:Sortase n=1 Tax=Cryobacterium breve TaxID=1259258 RepID=A0ABY7NCT1_9MICO|nr:sortase [Cryobacterium breve]WBM79385.1 sortase [Cryobacterium breve]